MAEKGYYRIGQRYFDNAAGVEYRCTTAGDQTSSVWVPVSGAAQKGTFVSDKGDYIVVLPSTGGSNINVAKPPKLRCSIVSDTQIDGTGFHTYTYTAVTVSAVIVAYTRTNVWTSGGGGTQVEQITPAYLVGDTVYYIPIPSENMPITPGSGTTITVSLIDVHEHDWAVPS